MSDFLRDNFFRQHLLGTDPNAYVNRTHCPKGHPYDEVNTYRIPSTGSRSCRMCARESHRTPEAKAKRTERRHRQ